MNLADEDLVEYIVQLAPGITTNRTTIQKALWVAKQNIAGKGIKDVSNNAHIDPEILQTLLFKTSLILGLSSQA